MGDTIAMDQLLTEFIEGQVRIVEGQRSAVPERCFEPVQRQVSQAATSSDSLHTSSGSQWADEWQGGSSDAAAAAQQQQTVWSDAAAAAAHEQVAPSSAAGSSSGGSAGSSAWSDDMASVLVVDYREPGESSETVAGSSAAAAVAAAEAAEAAPVEAAQAEPPAWQRSGIVGSSFDMGDASGSSSSGEDDWSSQLSALSGRSGHSAQRSGSDSDSEGRGNGSVEAGFGFDEQGAFVETHSRAGGEQLQYDAALERRLCRMEQQLQHITTLLEGQPPAQQAQHAQQPTWQRAMFEQQVRQEKGWHAGGCEQFNLPPPAYTVVLLGCCGVRNCCRRALLCAGLRF